MDLFSIATFVHLLAACTWLGGMIYINLIFMPMLKTIEPSAAGQLVRENGKRFPKIAWASVGLLIITGLMQLNLDAVFDFSTDYGTFLTLKLITIAVMISIGLYITFLYISEAHKSSSSEWRSSIGGVFEPAKKITNSCKNQYDIRYLSFIFCIDDYLKKHILKRIKYGIA